MTDQQLIDSGHFFPLKPNLELSKQRQLACFLAELDEFGDSVELTQTRKPVNQNEICYVYMTSYLYVQASVHQEFLRKFRYYIKPGNRLEYDNLINILFMVRDAGPGWKDVLTRNLPYADRVTVLDTGSIDSTVAITREVLKDVCHEIYQESFQGFRVSRNRLLDLAGNKCHFNIMLDDSYVLQGDIRRFLHIARGDEVADSFSLVIRNMDTMYTSNRVSKPTRGLRYIDDMHEILDTKNNYNCEIPYKEFGYILDIDSDYMKTRTMTRKLNDIKTLMRMHEESPENPRYPYYIGDSYVAMKDWPNAIEWFKKRVTMQNGNMHETQASLYYIAVISHMFLGKPWSECIDLYLACYDFDKTRAEPLYFLGVHYHEQGMRNVAFMYLKHAFLLGFPAITMSVRMNIYNYYIPKTLMELCYENREYKIGQECAERVLQYIGTSDEVEQVNVAKAFARKWSNVFKLINSIDINKPYLSKVANPNQKVICIVAPGGWNKWNGRTLSTQGLGGSETFCIGYAEALVRLGHKVLVFCNCDTLTHNEVHYFPIDDYSRFLNECRVDVVLVSRYCEYIGVSCLACVPKVYYMMHDLPLPEDIIPIEPNLVNIFCLTDWHKQFFINGFPSCKTKTEIISHGINLDMYTPTTKKKYSFIYSSFPNRGLIHLLEMFPKIQEIWPAATLDVFCDLDNTWTLENHSKDVSEVKILLKSLENRGVKNHGWVSQVVLAKYWSMAHVWLYPCVFLETACLTAYEAAASKTLVVSNNNAGLENTIQDRGVVVRGDPRTREWQTLCIDTLKQVLDTPLENTLIDKNYQWVQTKSFDRVAREFSNKYV